MNQENTMIEGRGIPATSDWSASLSRRFRGFFLKMKGMLVGLNPHLFWKLDTLARGKFFEPEINLLPQLCDKNKISIDVGANYGGYLTHMLPHSSSVIAFEPIPHLVRILRNAFYKERYIQNRVSVIGAAVSGRSGRARLRHAVYHPGFSTIEPTNDFRGKIRHDTSVVTPEVPMRSLDSYGLKDVGFIKVDVEGQELEVLQ